MEKKIKWGRKGKGKGKGKGREKEWGRRGKGTVNGGKALFSSLGKGEGKALIVFPRQSVQLLYAIEKS